FFSKGVLQDRLVEAEVCNESLELLVLIPQLPELPELGDAEGSVLLLPSEERRLAHPKLPADLFDRCPSISLPQRHRDLRFREATLSHRSLLPLRGLERPETYLKTRPHADQESGLPALDYRFALVLTRAKHTGLDLAFPGSHVRERLDDRPA